MRRSLAVLVLAASVVLGGVATATAADAAPSNRSVHTYGCADSQHPGKHKGWEKKAGPSTERRNVGGTCQGPE